MPQRKKNKEPENIGDLQLKGRRLEALITLSHSMRESEKREYVDFNEFLYHASTCPDRVFRDIFQYLYDMMEYYVGEGVDEYEVTEDSVGFVHYDFSKLFVENCDDPFFADRLFANRLMRIVNSFRQGIQNNRIYLFEGPPGSGKSTFLNNFLQKLEEYNRTREGMLYKTVWRLDIPKLGGLSEALHRTVQMAAAKEADDKSETPHAFTKRYLDISCPSNDHPILQIPKSYRERFLNELITDKSFRKKLFSEKEYRWVLKENPCSICTSVYNILLEKLGDPMEVFSMLFARRFLFERKFSRGISVSNPGDEPFKKAITDHSLQSLISHLLHSDEVKYVYSHLANTNNGVYALMDIKENNVQRLTDLHGIISDGVHKVELSEERIRSFFAGLVNPEDKKHYENIKSFQDRIVHINIPYVLDYSTEVAIYRNKFGERIGKHFLPGVLENFAKILIATRMPGSSPVINNWIPDPDKYKIYCDNGFLLLKMELYRGIIPPWLTEEDTRNFTREVRRALITESEEEGKKGVSGRQALNIFSAFLSKHATNGKLITMEMLRNYFEASERTGGQLPEDFMDSLVDYYDYEVLQQVKEALFFFSEKQVQRDILNYLYAVNYEPGATERCVYTGDILEINEDYFKNTEAVFLGTLSTAEERLLFRKETQTEYITNSLAYEMKVEGRKITETSQFQTLYARYLRNLKENALRGYAMNDNFRRAVLDFGSPSFAKFDKGLVQAVDRMISFLVRKFGYTEQGAVQMVVYVLDKKLDKKF